MFAKWNTYLSPPALAKWFEAGPCKAGAFHAEGAGAAFHCGAGAFHCCCTGAGCCQCDAGAFHCWAGAFHCCAGADHSWCGCGCWLCKAALSQFG